MYLSRQEKTSFVERKKTNYWPQRQFSSPISDVNDVSDMEFAIAVAAAAYAITSMEEESMNQNKTIEQLMHPTAKTKSKREDSIDKTPDYIRLIRWFTGKEAREDERESGTSLLYVLQLNIKIMLNYCNLINQIDLHH